MFRVGDIVKKETTSGHSDTVSTVVGIGSDEEDPWIYVRIDDCKCGYKQRGTMEYCNGWRSRLFTLVKKFNTEEYDKNAQALKDWLGG